MSTVPSGRVPNTVAHPAASATGIPKKERKKTKGKTKGKKKRQATLDGFKGFEKHGARFDRIAAARRKAAGGAAPAEESPARAEEPAR